MESNESVFGSACHPNMGWADRCSQIGRSETGLKRGWCSKRSVVAKWS